MVPVSVVESSLHAAPLNPAQPAPEVSIVVPGLNEGQSLPELARRIDKALGPLAPYELIFVDDGSTDDTWQRISALNLELPTVRGLSLRRNFGKAMALKAGFKLARAPILVMMDADLQDDPDDLPQFIAKSAKDTTWSWAGRSSAETRSTAASSRGSSTAPSAGSPR